MDSRQEFINAMWSDLAPRPGEGASEPTTNSAAVLTPHERAALERFSAVSGMSYSQVLRAAFRRLMRDASKIKNFEVEAA